MINFCLAGEVSDPCFPSYKKELKCPEQCRARPRGRLCGRWTANTVLNKSKKRESRSRTSGRFLKRGQARRLRCCVSTMVLSERGTVPGGNVSGARNRRD